jgi:flagellar motor switch protein FliN/FliY
MIDDTEATSAVASAEPQGAQARTAVESATGASTARKVSMPELAPGGVGEAAGVSGGNLDVILDIPVTISMEIGRTRIPIRDLLTLNQGSVVELDRLAGEPLDVLVNGTLIAHGEVVVINEHFGIRFTDVVSPAERVQKLR